MDERHESRAIRALGGRFNTTKLYHALNLDNNYKTTIYMIDSAIMKLSKLTKCDRVYRGMTGGLLPEQFWKSDDQGVRGGIEFAFLSVTRERDVAMTCAASRH